MNESPSDINRDNNPDFSEANELSRRAFSGLMVGEAAVGTWAVINLVQNHVETGIKIFSAGTLAVAVIGVIADRRRQRREDAAIESEAARIIELKSRHERDLSR